MAADPTVTGGSRNPGERAAGETPADEHPPPGLLREVPCDGLRPGGGDDLRVRPDLPVPPVRFREWSGIVMSVVAGWSATWQKAERDWDSEHTGVCNPFQTIGARANPPEKPGGAMNEQLAEMWPALTALLGERRVAKRLTGG